MIAKAAMDGFNYMVNYCEKLKSFSSVYLRHIYPKNPGFFWVCGYLVFVGNYTKIPYLDLVCVVSQKYHTLIKSSE